jgi:hypothetical protein
MHFSPISKIAPFIEQMGPVGTEGARRRREFAWEREWRHHGDLHFDWRDLVAVFAPEHRHASFQDLLDERGMAAELLNLLDPRWGLERMIGELASVRPEHVGPLPRY